MADFGFTRIRHKKPRTLTSEPQECFSLRHLAPERINSVKKDFTPTVSADIYALAMTILELATLDHAFAEYEYAGGAAAATARGDRPKQPSSLGNLGPQSTTRLYEILQSMWRQEPEQRRRAALVAGDLQALAKQAGVSASMGVREVRESDQVEDLSQRSLIYRQRAPRFWWMYKSRSLLCSLQTSSGQTCHQGPDQTESKTRLARHFRLKAKATRKLSMVGNSCIASSFDGLT